MKEKDRKRVNELYLKNRGNIHKMMNTLSLNNYEWEYLLRIKSRLNRKIS